MAGRALNKPVTSNPDVQAGAAETVQEPAIAARAYELWQERGCPNGSDQEDWFRAEQELKGRRLQPSRAA